MNIANIIGQNGRVRINANDPLLKVCEELGYNIKPENGQTEENCQTKVIFPIYSFTYLKIRKRRNRN